jgi:hypothetical protein
MSRLVVSLVLAGAFLAPAAPATAETCNPDGICLLTESSPENPVQIPAEIVARIPKGSYPSGNVSLYQKPDSLWHGQLGPYSGLTATAPPDGLFMVQITAQPSYNGLDCTINNFCSPVSAEFPLWVRTTVVDMSGTIRRQGTSIVASLAFTNRIPVTAEFHLGLQRLGFVRCGKPKPCPRMVDLPAFRQDVPETAPFAPGRNQVTRSIAVRRAERACKFKAPCIVTMRAYVLMPGSSGLGSFEREFSVKIKKKRSQPHR